MALAAGTLWRTPKKHQPDQGGHAIDATDLAMHTPGSRISNVLPAREMEIIVGTRSLRTFAQKNNQKRLTVRGQRLTEPKDS